MRSGTPTGAVRVLETGVGGEPLPESAWAGTGRGGTHAFGVAAAVELARALRRLPPRVVLVGVEAAAFDHGAPLTPEVAAAMPDAVDAVLRATGRAGLLTAPRVGLPTAQGVGTDVSR